MSPRSASLAVSIVTAACVGFVAGRTLCKQRQTGSENMEARYAMVKEKAYVFDQVLVQRNSCVELASIVPRLRFTSGVVLDVIEKENCDTVESVLLSAYEACTSNWIAKGEIALRLAAMKSDDCVSSLMRDISRAIADYQANGDPDVLYRAKPLVLALQQLGPTEAQGLLTHLSTNGYYPALQSRLSSALETRSGLGSAPKNQESGQ